MLQSKEVVYRALFGALTDEALAQDGLRADIPPAIASATTKPSEVQNAIQAMRAQATRRPGELPTSDTSMASSADKATSTGAAASPVTSSGSTPAAANAPEDANAKQTPKPVSAGTKAFWEQYKRGYSPVKAYPPRGCVAVTGMVVVDTPKAWLHIDVIGYWDPKEGAYDRDSMLMGLRQVRMKVVHPLR